MISVNKRHLQAIANLLTTSAVFETNEVEVLEPLPGLFQLTKVRTVNPTMGFPDEVTREPIGGTRTYDDAYEVLTRAVQHL